MIVIDGQSSLARITDPGVRALIERRADELGEDAGLATFVVVEPGDPIESLDAQLGFDVLVNRLDSARYGDPAFRPSFEVLEEHAGCYEMVFVLADHGDGVLVFIPKHDGVDVRLLSLCAEFATPEQS